MNHTSFLKNMYNVFHFQLYHSKCYLNLSIISSTHTQKSKAIIIFTDFSYSGIKLKKSQKTK